MGRDDPQADENEDDATDPWLKRRPLLAQAPPLDVASGRNMVRGLVLSQPPTYKFLTHPHRALNKPVSAGVTPLPSLW